MAGVLNATKRNANINIKELAMTRKREIGLRSYQDIPPDPRYEEPSTQDYFEMFFSAWSGKEEVSDDDYEIVHRWWYEFKAGTGCDWDDGVDTELEEMKNDLKEFDEGRVKHTCETCRKYGRCDAMWKNNCRTGCNDDYTRSDYWKKSLTDAEWEEEVKKVEANGEYWWHKYYNAREILKEVVKWANWEGSGCPNFKDIQTKAEQFLKENA